MQIIRTVLKVAYVTAMWSLIAVTGVIIYAGVTAPTGAKAGKLSPSKEFVWIRENQRHVAAKLKDPDSAKFAEDYVSYRSGAPVVCGTVNARNSFGAYVGAERYIAAGSVGTYLSSEVSNFPTLWQKIC